MRQPIECDKCYGHKNNGGCICNNPELLSGAMNNLKEAGHELFMTILIRFKLIDLINNVNNFLQRVL
jgi:hypothetical protein